MSNLRVSTLTAALMFIVGWIPAQAGGVAMAVQRSGEGSAEAKNGFLQAAYGMQLPGLNARPFELDGSDSDASTLQALKEQAPDLVFAVGALPARLVRQALPEAWIVYGMVFFPEVEGFPEDAKMVGVASLGSAKELGVILKAVLGKQRSLVVLHTSAVERSIPDLIARLKSEAGIDARGFSVESPEQLKGAVEGLKGQTPAVLFLPDSLAGDGEAFRGALAGCVASGIFPLAMSDALVAGGALCAAYYAPEEVGAQGAKLAREVLEGKALSAKIVPPPKNATSCNKATATTLRVKFPKEFSPETTYE